MTNTSGNEDGDAGTFSAPSSPGHRGHFGRGKPPPPMESPMQHDVPLEYTEWKATCHRTVRQGGGAKEAVVSGGGVEGDHGMVL